MMEGAEIPIQRETEVPTDQGDLYKLPTTSEIAKAGVQEFINLGSMLSPESKHIFTRREMLRCFTGISPEVRIEKVSISDMHTDEALLYFHDNPEEFHFPEEELKEIQTTINTHSETFYMFPTTRSDGSVGMFHVLNIPAIQTVISNYPEQFPPEAGTQTKEWLIHHQEEWQDWGNPTRYGLLSGFPLDSIEKYIEGNPSRHHIESQVTANAYIGYDPEKDKKYMDALDTIYQESGIVEQAKNLT